MGQRDLVGFVQGGQALFVEAAERVDQRLGQHEPGTDAQPGRAGAVGEPGGGPQRLNPGLDDAGRHRGRPGLDDRLDRGVVGHLAGRGPGLAHRRLNGGARGHAELGPQGLARTRRTAWPRRRRRLPSGTAGSAGPGGSRRAGSSRRRGRHSRWPPRARRAPSTPGRPRAGPPRTRRPRVAAGRAATSRRPPPPLTVMPSSRSAPSPGRPTAAVQVPFITTWTSTTAPGGSRSTTGSPSTDPSSPRARLISARHQRRARTGSSASANSSEASWLRAAGRSLRMRYASSPQLLRLRNLYPAAEPRVMRGRPRSWMVMLIVSEWSHAPGPAAIRVIVRRAR